VALLSAAFSPTGAFLATGNYFNSEVTMFAVNPATGALTMLGHYFVG
jgi:6-phosphogluconolactonase (cycloisomerase 2 family)